MAFACHGYLLWVSGEVGGKKCDEQVVRPEDFPYAWPI
jgi:hypothetical protein